MPVAGETKSVVSFAGLPSAKDLMKQVALKEAEKATAAIREKTVAEAEKTALFDKLSAPSGVSDNERLERAVAIIKRAANNGQTQTELGRFPNQLCTDRGRAINQQEQGWEKTLIGLPKELIEFWQKYSKPQGYKMRVQIAEFHGGVPGDFSMTLSWN